MTNTPGESIRFGNRSANRLGSCTKLAESLKPEFVRPHAVSTQASCFAFWLHIVQDLAAADMAVSTYPSSETSALWRVGLRSFTGHVYSRPRSRKLK